MVPDAVRALDCSRIASRCARLGEDAKEEGIASGIPRDLDSTFRAQPQTTVNRRSSAKRRSLLPPYNGRQTMGLSRFHFGKKLVTCSHVFTVWIPSTRSPWVKVPNQPTPQTARTPLRARAHRSDQTRADGRCPTGG